MPARLVKSISVMFTAITCDPSTSLVHSGRRAVVASNTLPSSQTLTPPLVQVTSSHAQKFAPVQFDCRVGTACVKASRKRCACVCCAAVYETWSLSAATVEKAHANNTTTTVSTARKASG